MNDFQKKLDELDKEYNDFCEANDYFHYHEGVRVEPIPAHVLVEKLDESANWLDKFINRWDIAYFDVQRAEAFDELVKQYDEWLTKNGYPSMSADELIMEVDESDEGEPYIVADPKDRAWLKLFIDRWDELEDFYRNRK